MNRTHEALWVALPVAAILCAFSALSATPTVADQGFFRTVDGKAALIQGDTGVSVNAEANYPVLLGDRIEVSPQGRIEALLEDGSYLRIAGDTELVFEQVEAASDTTATSALRLERGEIQLVLPADRNAVATLRVDTINASVHVETSGSYRIYSDGRGWTEVVVREGSAEVLTERGSSVVRAGEQATVNGARWPRVALRAAGSLDDLEIWGGRLLAAARETVSPHVDPRLGYASEPLARHGSWMYVGGRHAWRPAVEVGWRPYHYGRWGYTPAGLSWISPEPWGWVTYHYGYWDLAAGVGWIWYPGHTYTPAAVYWYWGPTHVAWVPTGYYHSYYRPHHRRSGLGFHPGVHGWAGGSISHWSNWTFCATSRFGGRGSYRDYSTGAELTRSGRMSVVPRGIVVTDTRAITPSRWKRPAEVMGILSRTAVDRDRGGSNRASLPDLTDWVARSPKLSTEAHDRLYGESQSTPPPLTISGRSSRPDAPSGSFDRSSVASRYRNWDRAPGDWTRRKPAQTVGSPSAPKAASPRPLVRGETGFPTGAGAASAIGSAFDRSVAGSSRDVWSSKRDWRGMPEIRSPAIPQSGVNATPPVRRVVDGMKAMRYQGRPGSAVASPPTSVGTGRGSSPSHSGGLAAGGSRSGSVRSKGSIRSGGSAARGTVRGKGKASSSRSTRGSGGDGG